MVLNYPADLKYDVKLGEISSYPPGYKENGGIFCHNNPWVMCAQTEMNLNEDAFTLYKKIAPAYLEDISDIHKTEPYVYSQMIAGKEGRRHGEAKNSWLTGTSAWNFVAISQYILGIRPDFNGLYINPKIPKEISHLTITRVFRNTTFTIHVKHDMNKGLFINGEKQDGYVVKNNQSKITVEVHV